MIVTRFAPSPTGYLHLGHAFAALTAHAAARGGRFLLRIDDLDRGRAREDFVNALFEDLAWLGLAWHEPVLRQSTRKGVYRAAVNRLEAQGLLYPCFCTRAEIAAEIARAIEAPHGPDGALYPGTCRDLSADRCATLVKSGAPYALRLDSDKSAKLLPPLWFDEMGFNPYTDNTTMRVDLGLLGDVVIARKGLPASYHLATVVDDAEQGVTLVTRGSDLLPATHVQRILQTLLGLSTPRYAHHRLIVDGDGRKLSKRNTVTSLRDLRRQGVSVSEIRAGLFES